MKAVRKSFKYRMAVAIYCLIHLGIICFFSFVDFSVYEKYETIIIIVLFLVDFAGPFTQGNLNPIFEKKLEEEMAKPDVEYVELKYFLFGTLWYCLIVADFMIPAIFALLAVAETPMEKIVSIGGPLLILMIPVSALIYRASTKIVLDHGQITKYVAGRKKVSGNVYEINPELTFRYYRNKGGMQVWNRICFGERPVREDNMIRYSEEMENSEQFCAYLKRRGFFEKIYE